MAVKLRLTRRGRKKLAIYDLIVADARSPRDGKFIEKLGTYNPNTDPATINIDDDRAFHWMMVGAQPTDTVHRILSYRGILMRKHLQIGVQKGAITQEEADKKYQAWMKEKEAQISKKVERLEKSKSDDASARLAAEKKVSDTRAEAIAKKNLVEEAPVVEVAEETAEAPTEVVATETTEDAEAPAAEAAAETAVEAVEEAAVEVTEEPAAEVVEEAVAEIAEQPAKEADEAPAVVAEAAATETEADSPAEEEGDKTTK